MRISPPTFPLSHDAFVSALRSGHGRVVQHVSRFGADGLEAEIIEACLWCRAFDQQSEAERAPWLAGIVELAGLRRQVLEALQEAAGSSPEPGYWDMRQRCGLARELATAGLAGARELLYSMLSRFPDTSDVAAADEIIALDGIAGLMHVAAAQGRWLHTDPDFQVDRLLPELLDDDQTKDGTAMAALEAAAASDPDVARYLAAICEQIAAAGTTAQRSERLSYSAAEVLQYVRSDPADPCFWLGQWACTADTSDLETVLEALLDETAPQRAARLLRCFGRVNAPRFDDRLIGWINHPDKAVSWPAVMAASRLSHPELRRTALELIETGNLDHGTLLLTSNYQPGDLQLCLARLAPSSDVEDTHAQYQSLLDLCEAHLNGEAVDCLLQVYEHSKCSACRHSAFEALHELGAVPPWMRQEATTDVDPDTRTLAIESCRA